MRFLLLLALLLSCSADRDTRERLEFWALGREGEVVAEMIPEFERRNPGIDVVVQQIPWSAAHEKLLTAYVGESTPDIAQMGNTWIPEFHAMRALEELPPAVVDRSDYFPGIWETNVIDGKLYGIPWYVDTRVLFYRSDILAAAGFPRAPRTWDEWRQAMARIAERRLSHFPILLPTNEFEQVEVLAMTNGSTLLNADRTRGAFRQPPFAEAFAFYVGLFRSGFAPAVSNAEIANIYQQFAAGDFAMWITGPWNVGECKRRLPPEIQGKWATAPLPARDAGAPTGVSMAGGSSLILFRGTRHRAAAEALIRFLSEPAQQVRFFELTGDLPARRSAWNAPALVGDPYFPAFRAQLERVQPLPKVPEWEQIATAIFDRGEAAARGVTSVPVALAQLDAKADTLLEKRRWMLSRRPSSAASRHLLPASGEKDAGAASAPLSRLRERVARSAG
ncbi:MAG: sugar ABC transporter substrate-binding protein [Acidobacteriota bacterium]